MDSSTLREYFRNPYDNNNRVVQYVNLWCRGKIQEFVEKHMDETNYKFFSKLFGNDECPVVRFKHDKWLTDDLWVYNSIVVDYRKLAEMSNKNVNIFARFVRMNYFLRFMEYNLGPHSNPCDVFYDIFEVGHAPSSKKLFK